MVMKQNFFVLLATNLESGVTSSLVEAPFELDSDASKEEMINEMLRASREFLMASVLKIEFEMMDRGLL